MIVVGGTYVERCQFPYWNQIYGSGLRAAIALSSLSSDCALHTYVNNAWSEDVAATLEAFGIAHSFLPTVEKISFHYLYGFERLTMIDSDDVAKSQTIEVSGNSILCFGMMEGGARVRGKRVIFDPQYADVASFWRDGSEAESLALILNSGELVTNGGLDWPSDKSPWDATREERRAAAQNIFDTAQSAHVVIVEKHRLGGADVYLNDESPVHIPAYAADSFFKIGLGDVFSAAFAYAWGASNMHPVEAATYATLCAAHYAENRQLLLQPPDRVEAKVQVVGSLVGRIALTGSVTEGSAELLRHAESFIRSMGCSVGLQLIDLQGGMFAFDPGDVILAIFDTNVRPSDIERFRVLVADRQLIAFAPSAQWISELLPGALVFADYASALYMALRKARR